MAIFHLSMKTVKRSMGESSVAAAAYRAGAELVDERTGEIHDYTKKSDMMDAFFVVASGAKDIDRNEFWNSVEKHHKRGDAVTARHFDVSIPPELNAEQRREAAAELAEFVVGEFGVGADVAMHSSRRLTKAEIDALENPLEHKYFDNAGHPVNGNYHAHILLTACSLDANGKLGKKAEALDPIHCQRHKIPNAIERIRPAWEQICNRALERAGIDARVDHRSNEARGIDEAPSKHRGERKSAELRSKANKELKAEIENGVESIPNNFFESKRKIEAGKGTPEIVEKYKTSLLYLENPEAAFRELKLERDSRWLDKQPNREPVKAPASKAQALGDDSPRAALILPNQAPVETPALILPKSRDEEIREGLIKLREELAFAKKVAEVKAEQKENKFTPANELSEFVVWKEKFKAGVDDESQAEKAVNQQNTNERGFAVESCIDFERAQARGGDCEQERERMTWALELDSKEIEDRREKEQEQEQEKNNDYEWGR